MTYINEAMIEEQLKKHNYQLLGQIEVSDEQYNDLLSYMRVRARCIQSQTVVPPNLMVALGLVQIAIRHYKEGRFWPCFLEQLGFDLPSSKTNYLGQIFYKTIQKYGLFCPHKEGTDFQYVEYIKAHAFVTNFYMQGFYDFAYAYYENNLFRQLTDDLSEDMESLSFFMETTLSSKADTITAGTTSEKAAKSYRLLKSTRTAFAQCDPTVLSDVFYPILDMIDVYFYDNEKPEIPTDRFQKGFLLWCTTQEEREYNKNGRTKAKRQVLHHKPFIKVLVDKEQVFLIIPAQKFRQEDCDGHAEVEITIGRSTEIFPLEIYQSFGLYILEEMRIPIPGVFDSIDITIRALSEKDFRISPSTYRIFNNSWESIDKFNKGHNYILVKPGIETAWEHKEDLIDYTDVYRNWQYFSANINNESVFYVGNKPLSIIGEFSAEPVYEKQIEYFSVYCDGDKKLTATQSHPTISFVLEKARVNGTVLLVNDFKYTLDEIQEKACYDWPTDKNKLAVTIILDQFLYWTDGYYSVKLDIPGDGVKSLCEYVLLREFKCRFNRPRYTYVPEAELSIKKGDYDLQVLDPTWRIVRESETGIIYGIPLDNPAQDVSFILQADKDYRITIPLKVFCYGFSVQELRSQKEDYIWYADLKENLYVRIPGAKAASAYLDRDRSLLMHGESIGSDLFRIDISEFVNTIKTGGKQYYYINVEYTDNATRWVPLPVIYRNVEIKPYFKIYAVDGAPYMDVSIIGKAEVYLTAKEHEGETVFERKAIQNGVTQLPELSMEKLYDLIPIMEESDEFGLDVSESVLKPIYRIGAVDLGNLINCRLPISKSILNEDAQTLSYDYSLDLREKEEDGVYTGFAFGYKLVPGKGKRQYELDASGKKVKVKLGRVRVLTNVADGELTVSVQCYSYIDEDWMLPYYDSKTKEVIHCDDKRLESHGALERFLMLEEEICYYTVDTSKIKRIG